MPNYDEFGNLLNDDGSVNDPSGGTAADAINTPGTPPPPAATTGTGSGDPQALWNQYRTENPSFHPRQSDPASLQPFVDWAKTHGVTGLTLAAPSSGGYVKGFMYNGQFIKALDGTDQPIWQVGGDTAAGPAAPSVDASYLRPFTTQFADFAPTAVGTGDGNLNPPEFKAPGPFQRPTAESILTDPSYQWQEGRIKGAIENSAAARGTLNSGGTLNDIMQGVGGFASQEYNNIWNRDFGLWDTDWRHALDTQGLKVGTNNTAYQRTMDQFLNARDTYYQNQDRPFSKLYSAASLGAGASA